VVRLLRPDGPPARAATATEDDLADPTLPLRLALAYVEGEAGYRPTKFAPDVAIWYWSRAGDHNRWWLIPTMR
jgi:hypothetical protein